jgi:hypothetical protein
LIGPACRIGSRRPVLVIGAIDLPPLAELLTITSFGGGGVGCVIGLVIRAPGWRQIWINGGIGAAVGAPLGALFGFWLAAADAILSWG